MVQKLLTYGDLLVDTFVSAPIFPQPGQDSRVEQFAMLPGGSAANCAVVAARLGTSVEFLGLAGRDLLSGMQIDDLVRCGVGTTYLRQVEGPSAVVIAIIGDNGERTFFSYRGVNAQSYGAIPVEALSSQDCLHVSGYCFQNDHSRETALNLMAMARQTGALISVDPSFHFAKEFGENPSDLLSGVDFIFPNETEARLLAQTNDLEACGAAIRAYGVKTVVVTTGSDGCYINRIDKNEIEQAQIHVPAYPVTRVVDTTGAGDAFCGGVLAATLRGLDIESAARIGHAAAAHVITEIGGHTGAPSWDQLLQFASDCGDPVLASALISAATAK